MTGASKAWLAILAAVVLLPFVVRHAIATEIWIFAIFGLGLNLLMGYTGLLSFGQATFFGSAAYVAGYLLKYYGDQRLPRPRPSASRWARCRRPLVGYLCVQRSGLYFIMLTFALNQMFYFIGLPVDDGDGRRGRHARHPAPERPRASTSSGPLAYYVAVAAAFPRSRSGS